ncbi:hypothetical protein LCGC14_2905990, partial [marine sediment metagenome]
ATSRLIADAHFGFDPLTAIQRDLWSKVSSFEAATKLSTAVISNTTQPALLSLVVGNRALFRGIHTVIKDFGASEAFATRSGAITNSVLREFRRSIGLEEASFGAKVLRRTGFTRQEKWNRIISAVIGREFAKDMFRLLKIKPTDTRVRRALKEWTALDPDDLLKKGALAEDDLLMAAKRMSDRTQFRTGPLDLPFAWQSSVGGRMLTLYKSFGFNQARLFRDSVLQEVRRGNLRPLLPLVTTVPLAGEFSANVKAFIFLRDRPTDLTERILEDYFSVGAIGIIEGMLQSAALGKGTEFFAGPILSEGGDVLDVIGSERPGREAIKEGLKRIPVAGRGLSKSFAEATKP